MIRGLYLVELAVSDWSAAVAWYRDGLGLEVLFQNESDRFALLVAGTVHLVLKGGQPVPGGVLLAFEVDDLPAELERLARRGVVTEAPLKVSPEGYRRAIVRDLDGYRLSLFDWRASVPTLAPPHPNPSPPR